VGKQYSNESSNKIKIRNKGSSLRIIKGSDEKGFCFVWIHTNLSLDFKKKIGNLLQGSTIFIELFTVEIMEMMAYNEMNMTIHRNKFQSKGVDYYLFMNQRISNNPTTSYLRKIKKYLLWVTLSLLL
jgi:hypothetical protein